MYHSTLTFNSQSHLIQVLEDDEHDVYGDNPFKQLSHPGQEHEEKLNYSSIHYTTLTQLHIQNIVYSILGSYSIFPLFFLYNIEYFFYQEYSIIHHIH